MSTFIEECRREWRRLGVPDPIADEMAGDLAADLEDAAADGISPEDVLGSSASDPRGFAAAWASERGLVRPPGHLRVARRGLLIVVGVLVVLLLATVLPLLALSTSRRHGRPTSARTEIVPNVVGLRRALAEAKLAAASFHARPLLRARAGIAPGVVFIQSPSPGSRLTRGRTVAVYVSATRHSAGASSGLATSLTGGRDRFVLFGALPSGLIRLPLPRGINAPSRTVGHLAGTTIYVAPRRNGYCQMFAIGHERAFGGCVARSTVRDAGKRSSGLVAVEGIPAKNGYVVFGGSTQVAPGTKLYVVYADGTRQRLSVIWVSRPIRAGFIFSVLPKAHRTHAHRAVAIETTNSRGVVARQVLPVPSF